MVSRVYIVVAFVVGFVGYFFSTTGFGPNCLTAIEREEGANLVEIIDHDGARYLEYFRFGVQTPGSVKIVLQHGSFREGGMFGFFDDFFKQQNLDVIAPTLPGSGCSSPKPERKISEWAEDLKAVMLHAGWKHDEEFLIAGFSFGAPHALAVSSALPDQVKGCLFVSSTLPPELKDLAESMATKTNQSIQRDVNLGLGVKTFQMVKRNFPLAVSHFLFSSVRFVRGLNNLSPAMSWAMANFRLTGRHALASALEDSAKRAHSRSDIGTPANFRIRDDRHSGLNLSSMKLRRNVPLLFITESSDKIDPAYITDYLVSLVKDKNPDTQHVIMSNEFGHWHYWANLEEYIRLLMSKADIGVESLDSEIKVGIAESSCFPSAMREFGPFYKPNSPFKNEVCEFDKDIEKYGFAYAKSTFTRSHTPGAQKLVIGGKVLAGTDCSPVSEAEIDIWQSHQYGRYGSLNPGEEEGFCRAVVKSDEFGRYTFETYLPGSYGGLAGQGPIAAGFDIPPFVDRHIHLAVWARGYELLVTQMLWADDVMLNSTIRAGPHGYKGVGIIIKPEKDDNGVWKSNGVDLILPKRQRKGRLHSSRNEAVRKQCDISTGDFLTPTVCMPSIATPTGIVPPVWIYLGAVGAVYLALFSILVFSFIILYSYILICLFCEHKNVA